MLCLWLLPGGILHAKDAPRCTHRRGGETHNYEATIFDDHRRIDCVPDSGILNEPLAL